MYGGWSWEPTPAMAVGYRSCYNRNKGVLKTLAICERGLLPPITLILLYNT